MTRQTAARLIEFTDCYMCKSCRDYGERNHDALMMGAKALKDHYIGLCADEQRRFKYDIGKWHSQDVCYPLAEEGISEHQILPVGNCSRSSMTMLSSLRLKAHI